MRLEPSCCSLASDSWEPLTHTCMPLRRMRPRASPRVPHTSQSKNVVRSSRLPVDLLTHERPQATEKRHTCWPPACLISGSRVKRPVTVMLLMSLISCSNPSFA